MDPVAPPRAPPELDALLPRLTRYLDYFQALAEIAKALTGNLKLDDVLETICRCVAQVLKPQHWSLLLVDAETNELYFQIAVGPAAPAIRHLRLRMGEGIAGWVAERREAVVVPRVADDPRFSVRMDKASNFQTASILCVPLVCRSHVLGVIELVKDAGDPEPYGPEHLEVLAPLADFAAIAIDNARTFARIEELTILDEWTGVYNARFLRTYLEEETRRARRYRHELSVAFIDLDRFKAVNDTHGHAVGSALLREVGRILRSVVRDTDRVARYGGDEFVVVMPETAKNGALALAERLRSAVESGALVTKTGALVRITASFGVATFPLDADGSSALLTAADHAMYEVKEHGRNAVGDAGAIPSSSSQLTE